MNINKIDLHIHVTLERSEELFNGMNFASCGEMKELLPKLGIERAVLMSSSEDENGMMSNKEVCAIANRYPETYTWFCNIDATNSKDIEERLRKYKEMGAKAVGEFMTNLRIDDERIENVFAACEKLEMPLLFHMSPEENKYYGIVDEPGLPLLEKALKKYPKLTFIGHSQPFWHEITKDADPSTEKRNGYSEGPVVEGGRLVELFRKYPNLCGDLSANSGGNALMRDPEFGYSFLEEFQDRLFFATDMVNLDMIRPLGAWLDESLQAGKISSNVYEKVCRKNAEGLLNL